MNRRSGPERDWRAEIAAAERRVERAKVDFLEAQEAFGLRHPQVGLAADDEAMDRLEAATKEHDDAAVAHGELVKEWAAAGCPQISRSTNR